LEAVAVVVGAVAGLHERPLAAEAGEEAVEAGIAPGLASARGHPAGVADRGGRRRERVGRAVDPVGRSAVLVDQRLAVHAVAVVVDPVAELGLGPDAPHTDEVPLAVALELARLAWRKAPIAGELDGVVGHGAGAHGGDAVVDDSVAVVVEVVALLRLRADVADAIESSAHTGERARLADPLVRAADIAHLGQVAVID